MDEKMGLQMIKEGKMIKSISKYFGDSLYIKNFIGNQICKMFYARGIRTIRMIVALGIYPKEQEESVKNSIADTKISACVFKEYFCSLPIKKTKQYDFASRFISDLNDCETENNQYTLEECINMVLKGEIAVLNLKSKAAFLIYHAVEKQIYYVFWSHIRGCFILEVLFNEDDIENNKYSSILDDVKFTNKNKRIITMYRSFENYFTHTSAFDSLFRDVSFQREEESEIIPEKVVEETMVVYPDKINWKEFKDSGLLWFVNSILHVFGWSITLEMNNGEIIRAYPQRCVDRGFSEETNKKEYINISQYMKDHAEELLKEAKE